MKVNFKQIESALKGAGFRVSRNKWSADYISSLFNVDTVIDIGVANGTPELYDTRISKKLILVDPQPVPESLTSQLRAGGFQLTCVQAAVGEEAGETELFVHANPDHSSLLSRTAPFAAINSKVETATSVPIQPLDKIVEALDEDPGRVGLKIDTEGFEPSVLRGAEGTLEKCEFVIIETSLKRRFDPAYPPSEVIGLMHKNGFEILDILNQEYRTPKFLDILFARWSGEYFNRP